MNRLLVRALAAAALCAAVDGGRRRRCNADGVLRPETEQGRAGASLRPALEAGQDGRSLDPRHDEPEPCRLVHGWDTGRGDSAGERNGQRRRRPAQRSGPRRLRRTVPRLRPVLGRRSADTADYLAWIDGFAAGIGASKAVVMLEPDGLGIIPYNTTSTATPSGASPTVTAHAAPIAAARRTRRALRADQLRCRRASRPATDAACSTSTAPTRAWLGVGDIA